MGQRTSDGSAWGRVPLIRLGSNLIDVLYTLNWTGEVLRLPDLPELEFIFQAEEILSTKPHPQAEIVDLPYCLLCCSQFLQAFKKLFAGIPGLVVFELQWIPVPF